MRIAILGTRGIPNYYGGFEQFAEYLAKGLVGCGHEITVYNSHLHPYQETEWNGVKLVHCNDPEDKWGTVGQFVYDLNCILHTRTQPYDIILQLGYTSSSIWGWLLPRKKCLITTNMDGLEWKRTKYTKPVRAFLKIAEYLGIIFSNHLIADSLGIQEYLLNKYQIASTYIPYGAYPFETPDPSVLTTYNVGQYAYNMLIARLEPENNVDTILAGVSQTQTNLPFLVIGKHTTKYGEFLRAKYAAFNNIRFIGGIYDITALNNLRYYSNIYFHGHSVGGTNPSLLEAMGSMAFICAHNNIFNRSILGPDAYYFENSLQVKVLLGYSKQNHKSFINCNLEKIRNTYSWDKIIEQYEKHFIEIYKRKY